MSPAKQIAGNSLAIRRFWPVAAVLFLCGLAILFWGRAARHGGEGLADAATLKLEDIPFDGAKAYQWLKRLCELGPRPSGSPGMAAQQKLLSEYFQALGGEVELQRFRARHPRDGTWVEMANLLVRWAPKSRERILLCAHYDTLPFPLLDRKNPRGVFLGANDNAGGVALLMELARLLPEINCQLGVDFAFFDGEEFIFRQGDPLFLGSEFFARQYAREQARAAPPYRYRWAVLVDMIGDADLRIPKERNSYWWRDTRPLIEQIWATAARLDVKEFLPYVGQEVEDDHLILHNVGRIPCIDIIDFEYPVWHTQEDTPERCSPLSLAKVGWVLSEWLKNVK